MTPKIGHDPAYKVALDALSEGLCVTMIPGTHAGDLAVYSRSCRLSGKALRAATSRSDLARVVFLIGLTRMVRDEAQQHGMSF